MGSSLPPECGAIGCENPASWEVSNPVTLNFRVRVYTCNNHIGKHVELGVQNTLTPITNAQEIVMAMPVPAPSSRYMLHAVAA
jgi:hypothetical protein